MSPLTVELGDRSYPIYIGANLLESTNVLKRHISGKQVCVVSNTTVGPLYAKKVLNSLKGYDASYVELPDGEQFKTLEVLNTIFDRLLNDRQSRNTTIIAVGGGVVGDMAGFAAACYQRGVNFIQMPTTLLSQVDSSVGGKTGVNHVLGKNMIGAFYQPQAVFIDIDVLATLPSRELSAGLAEVIKYGLIWDEAFFFWLEDNIEALLKLNSEKITYAIKRSCAIKAEVVAQDEREGGIRAILNLGHTFGHAIETDQGYGAWLHGEAVGAGMVLALRLSRALNLIDDHYLSRSIELISRAGLPISPPAEMTGVRFLELMSVDKKVVDGRLRLILPELGGTSSIFSDVQAAQILALFDK